MNSGFTFPPQRQPSSDAQSLREQQQNDFNHDHVTETPTSTNNKSFAFPINNQIHVPSVELGLDSTQMSDNHNLINPSDKQSPINQNFQLNNPNVPIIDIPSPIEIPETIPMNNTNFNVATISSDNHTYNNIQNNTFIPAFPSKAMMDPIPEPTTVLTDVSIIQQNFEVSNGPISTPTPILKSNSQENATTPTDSINISINDKYALNLRQQMATDWKNPSEYALHIIFTKFIRATEIKLNLCIQGISNNPDKEPLIVNYLAKEIDPNFDSIIESLGHIAKKKPKPVIDAMMFWRKTKSEIANTAAKDLENFIKEYQIEKDKQSKIIQPRRSPHSENLTRSNSKKKIIPSLNESSPSSTSILHQHKRNVSSKSSMGSNRKSFDNNSMGNSLHPQFRELETLLAQYKLNALQAERKSLISIYILCRVLMEIVIQTPGNSDHELNDKLEEIVFTQLKTTNPLSISSSVIKSTNWNSFAELLGYMSEKKFVSVTDRFISDLEKLPKIISPENEPPIHLLILGMRYIKLQNYPLEKFEESADFMKSLSKFFNISENLSIRLAYSEVINQLLLPLAGTLTAEVNHPTWVEAMTTLLHCSAKFLQSEHSKFWAEGFKLTVSILCASPPTLFTNQWISLIQSNSEKIKTKNMTERVFFARGLSRLIWVYLYRCTETLNNTTKTLTSLLPLYLNKKKKQSWLSPNLELINPLCDTLVSVGYLHPNFLIENAIIPLIRQSFNGATLENMNCEKLMLAINSYKGLLMTTERPEFPGIDNRVYELNLNKTLAEKFYQNEALSQNNEEVSSYFYKLFLLLDSVIGSEVWSPENQHKKQQSTPFGSFGLKNFSNDNDSNINKNHNLMLFAIIIETIPCCLSISANIPYKSTIEILARNAVHADHSIATSSQNALKALASKKNPYTLITWFAKYSFDFDEKTQSSYNMSYLSSAEYHKLLTLYVNLLQCWLNEFQSSNSEETKKTTGLDGIQLLQVDSESDASSESEQLEWKNIVTVIEEVEGNGLFFLCAHDSNIRQLAIKILRIISKFDEAMAEKTINISNGHSRSSSSHFVADQGTRLIDVLNNCDVMSLFQPYMTSLSAIEKSRLVRSNSRFKKGLIVTLAESNFGIDSALWQRVFPRLLSLISKSCPITMALCRSIVCIRLVQVHEIVLHIANSSISNTTTNINDEFLRSKKILPETIINQWKSYLIAACTSLTSTSDQRLHIPTKTMQHGRKKSQQIFTVQHQKIKSAKSIFKMVLPLLNSKHIIIRDAIIAGLSSMNINIYKTYIESIDPFLNCWKEDTNTTSNKTRVEMFHVLTILREFLSDPSINQDEWILKKISGFIKRVKAFLEQESVQISYEYQALRNYFPELLKKYYNTIRTHSLLDQLFPFQARTSTFNYLKEWCGYGEYAHVATERYKIMIQKSESNRDKTAVSSGIEFQRTKLEMLALETMVTLCSDPITKKIEDIPNVPIVLSFDSAALLSWIEALFDSNNETVRNLGVEALENLLDKNTNNAKLFKAVSLQCISSHTHPSVSVLYYTTLCKSVLKLDDLILEEGELVSLGLYGIVSDREETRIYAVDLLSAVETKLHNSSYAKVFKERLANSSKTVYKSTAKEISSIFAELLSQDLCLKIFCNLTRMLDLFPFEAKRDLLVLIVPWVNRFTLKSIEELETFMILNNLFYITIELNNVLLAEIEQLWISLGKGNSFQNIHVSLEYILQLSILHGNPIFVQYARDVVLYLSNVPGGIGVMDSLLNNLEPKAMIPDHKKRIVEPDTTDDSFFVANIWESLNYQGKAIMFSKAQLSIIFLVNLLTNPTESIKSKLSSLLHISICLLDHYVPLIQECASKIVCNLIFGLAPTHEKSEEVVELIRNRNLLWSYDNLFKDKKGARSPKSMDSLIRNLIGIFSAIPDFQTEWQKTALKWATTCSVRHVACRSFQVFRSLLTFLDQKMLKDMLHRLSNTISDSNTDIQGFAMQILMTLNAIMAELDPTYLISFPQLFWSIIACLNSIHEQEFIEVLSCITKFISKIDLDSPDTVQCLIATFPSNWEGRFDGLQPIVMTGLRSSNSFEITLKFLDKLNLLKDSQIIANPDSRLLFALISNLPRFLNAMDKKDFSSIQNATDSLISLSNINNQPSLSRLIDSLAKNKFRSKKDFMSQVVSFISRNYFPTYAAQTLVFFLGLLLNKVDWIKIQTLAILKYVFPLVDLTSPEFTGVGADLISPLLRLLLTKFDTQALEVLDCVPNISGSKMDKDVLRISMGNKDVQSSSITSTTLFGLPEESGWSIPMPTMTAATTRHNVHSVFMTCTNATTDDELAEEPIIMDDVVEFHADGDYGLGRIDTIDSVSVAEEKDASLSHMWAELDNLDSFFTKDSPLNITGSIINIDRR
ncbi:Tao3p NDAI_0F00190 [Naumovozyma dairenensis CBS 421]|uniref:Cell morphogenesis protein PAG1 n=1 Tax=Naumovozyma dairenensis (strain ATCC 10597 / BCRC 20456 / CBS 421 / NBRC 0211 / NRRL Y-12639) TaxID=1071378 RepID=G0WC27_NAUDC|nr:hypothetical protein NDAI_0F00190 [Naumovozyma dairenensis CBS 421]CCD25338.1 hypothetical protein NDAI_0F00190 [Naumovozyma dairenensis CBS 421]